MHFIQDALIWYAEKNAGQLPQSWDDVVNAGLAARSDEYPNGLLFHPNEESKYWHVSFPDNVYIEDVRRYKIMFGYSPKELVIRKDGVFDRQGRPLRLMAPVGETWNDGLYDGFSWQIARAMKDLSAKAK
jgi:hypothetical protein